MIQGKKSLTKFSSEAEVSRSSCELMYMVSNSGRVIPMPRVLKDTGVPDGV